MDITSWKQLEKALLNSVRNSMEETGNKCEEVVREQIEEDVYSSYEPVEYTRTKELKNSIIHDNPKIKGNVVTTEIKHNTDMIGSYPPNQHMSVVDGSSSVHSIAEIVHEGLAPNIFNDNDYPWMHRRPYMDNAAKKIKDEQIHVKSMKDSLMKKGFEVI
jgi:hypothetical protein